MAESFPELPAVPAASVEQHFYLYADAPCRLFPGGRRGAGSGTVPPVSRRIYRYTGNGEAGNRCRTLTSPAEAAAEHTGLEKARKLFLLLFMLRGIPFVDIAYLRRCDLEGDILTYRRRKTGAWLTVRIEPEARKLIRALQSTDEESPYLFSFIRYPGVNEYRQYQHALRRFNLDLRKLSSVLGQKTSLSSYSARHSWATLANFCDYQQELISNAMGHSSVKVTETYFQRHSDDRIHAMNRGILSRVFADKGLYILDYKYIMTAL